MPRAPQLHPHKTRAHCLRTGARHRCACVRVFLVSYIARKKFFPTRIECNIPCMYAGTCTDSTLRTRAAMSSSKKGFKLPGFLQLKQTPNRGRGVFTTKRFRCGEEVLTCKPYAIGVSATTAAGLRQLCHQCLKTIPSSRSAIVCDHCQLVAYCCKPCQDEALPVHRVECEGLAKLELDRGKVE